MFISCFRVYRPLTLPYMRFRIRRFLFWIPFEVRIKHARVACLAEVFRRGGDMHDWRTTHPPISPTSCVIPSDSTFHEVLYSGLGEFPSLPYTHAYSPSALTIRLFQCRDVSYWRDDSTQPTLVCILSVSASSFRIPIRCFDSSVLLDVTSSLLWISGVR